MTPERWLDVERLFHEALAREPERRGEFLWAACGPDSELRGEVQSLLATEGCDSRFLERSVLQEAARQLALQGPPPLVGRSIGRYEIVELLGAGGMGEVYRAHDTVLDRHVALKVLFPAYPADTGAVTHLVREAQSAARLSHPNICTVHEVGSFEGRPFLAMEYVEGQTLAQKLRDGAFPARRVLDYGIQIARALAHAHERQILHKDLKSANVIVTSDEQIKVVDFGIARRMGPAGIEQVTLGASQTSRVLAGTPAYMAPEVLRGEAADVRSDVWALGVLLYEMASGTHPFSGVTAFEVIASIMAGPPTLRTSMPPGLRTVVQRCLTVDRAERYQRLADVALALEEVRATMNLVSPDGSGPHSRRLANLIPRSRLRLLPAAAAVGLLALFGAGWWAVRSHPAPFGVRPSHDAPIRLAIPPFDVRGPGDVRTLGIGLADSLITGLAAFRTLQLPPTTVSERFEGAQQNPMAFGRELHVDYLLLGRAVPRGDDYDFTLKLVRVGDGITVWGDQITVPTGSPLETEQIIIERVARALNVPFTGEGRPAAGHRDTANPEARRTFLRGRALMSQRADPELVLKAFEDAVRLDPGYARAQAGLAHFLARKYWQPQSPEAAARYRARALQAAELAVRLDPNLAEAYEALSSVYRYNEAEWEKVIDASRKALALNPALAIAHHNMANAFYHLGLSEFSDQESVAGVRADPDSRVHGLRNRARAALYDGRFSSANQLIGEVNVVGDPGDAWLQAEARFYLGRREESERALRTLLAEERTGVMLERARASLASLLASTGRRREAKALLGPLLASPADDHHVRYRIATTYAQLGEAGEAVRWLRRSAETGFPCYPWFTRDTLLDPVRSDPLFLTLMAEQRRAWTLRHARYAPLTPAPLFARAPRPE